MQSSQLEQKISEFDKNNNYEKITELEENISNLKVIMQPMKNYKS